MTGSLRAMIVIKARRGAHDGRDLMDVLDDVAALVLDARQRYGDLGRRDEDSSWAADLAIDAYEGRFEGRITTLTERACPQCERLYIPSYPLQVCCSYKCRARYQAAQKAAAAV